MQRNEQTARAASGKSPTAAGRADTPRASTPAPAAPFRKAYPPGRRPNAKRKLAKAIRDNRGIPVNHNEDYTVAEWCRLWFETYSKPVIRPNTAKTYEKHDRKPHRTGYRRSQTQTAHRHPESRRCTTIPRPAGECSALRKRSTQPCLEAQYGASTWCSPRR